MKKRLSFTTWFLIYNIVILFSAFFPGPGGHGLQRRFLGGGMPAPSSGPTLPTDLGLLMQYTGDQILSLPNGAYTTAQINYLASTTGNSNPNTGGSGQYGGWLLIVAQNPGQVTVDLTANGFNLGPQGGTNSAYRILFAGIAFSNGDVALFRSHFLRFWYCSFTFSSDTFKAQYIAAGGTWPVFNQSVINSMVNPNCRGIGFVDDATTSPYNSFLGVYGCTFKTISNDACYCQPSNNVDIQGNYFIDIFHHTEVLPNPNPALGAYFHSDSYQSEWGSVITFAQNTIANGDLQIENNDSGHHYMAITDNWFGGSPNQLATLDEFHQGAGSFTGCISARNRGWSGGQYQNGNNGYTQNPSYDSAYDQGIYLNGQTGTFVLPSGWTQTSDTFSSGGGSKPTGVTVTSGLITDLPNNPSEIGNTNNGGDPALNWQNANPYNSYLTYFGGNNMTLTDASITNGSNQITSASGKFVAGMEGMRVQAPGIRGDCYIHFVNSTTITLKDHGGTSINALATGTNQVLVIGSGGWN